METKDTIHFFISALRKEGFRKEVAKAVSNMNILPPFDIVVEHIMKQTGTLPKKDILNIARLHLSTRDVEVLSKIEDVSDGVAIQCLEELQNESIMEDLIGVVSNHSASASEKLSTFRQILEASYGTLHEPRAKKRADLDTTRSKPLMEFLHYPLHRNKLILLAAYPGIGKTTLSLVLAKQAYEQDLSVLYICIGDWDEPSMADKLKQVDMDMWMALYDKATIYEIGLEIEAVKPDVVIIDSLSNITSHHLRDVEGQYYMELGLRAKSLRELANQHNVCMLTTHQLKVLNEVVEPEDLMASKAHLLAEVDLALGVGGKRDATLRNVSTLKVRNFPCLPVFRIEVDYEKLHVYPL